MYLRKFISAILENILGLYFTGLVLVCLFVGLSTPPRKSSTSVLGVTITPVVTPYLDLLDQLPGASKVVVAGLMTSNPVQVDSRGERTYGEQLAKPVIELVIQLQFLAVERRPRQYNLLILPDFEQYCDVSQLTLGAEIEVETQAEARPYLESLELEKVQALNLDRIVRIRPKRRP